MFAVSELEEVSHLYSSCQSSWACSYPQALGQCRFLFSRLYCGAEGELLYSQIIPVSSLASGPLAF